MPLIPFGFFAHQRQKDVGFNALQRWALPVGETFLASGEEVRATAVGSRLAGARGRSDRGLPARREGEVDSLVTCGSWLRMGNEGCTASA